MDGGTAPIPRWYARSAAVVDRVGQGIPGQGRCRAAVLGVPSPGVWFGDRPAAIRLARQVNEAGAEIVRDAPEFGLYGCLPLPDVPATLTEVAYCVDELAVDGFIVFSNWAGHSPGDPQFLPVWEELDRRGRPVLMHPCSPCESEGSLGVPGVVAEFPLDTTRAIVDLILSGALDKFRNLRLIVSHAGAALPVLADRMIALAPALVAGFDGDIQRDLEKLYYDLAGPVVPRQLRALLDMVSADRLVYASDAPFMPPHLLGGWRKALESTELFTDSDRVAIARETAASLFPRVAGVR